MILHLYKVDLRSRFIEFKSNILKLLQRQQLGYSDSIFRSCRDQINLPSSHKKRLVKGERWAHKMVLNL